MNIATSALNQNPDDPALRLLLVQHMAQWGLFHRAASVCEPLRHPSLSNGAEFADLIASFRQIRADGRLDPAFTERTFADNLAIAHSRFGWAKLVEEAWKSERLELHRTREGDFLAFDPQAGPEGRWRPVFGRLRAKAAFQEIRAQVEQRVVAPIVFDGIGLGSQLDVYYKATHDTMLGASPVLYVVESSPVAIAVALHLFDWRELLTSGRVVWCVGDVAIEELRRALRERPNVPAPQNIVVAPLWNGAAAGRVREIVSQHREQVDRENQRMRAKVETLYSGRDSACWAGRYQAALSGAGPALRVMAITSRFTTVLQYSTRDAMEALKAIGCETRTLIEADPHSYISTSEAMSAFREFEPDMVFMIDHTRKTQAVNLIDKVPLVTWVQDRLPWLFDDQSGLAMGSLDFCIGQSAEELTGRYKYPTDRFFPCEMATHFASLMPNDTKPDPEKFACDVAYATHASEPPAEFHRKVRERAATPELKRLIDAVYDSMTFLAVRGDLNGSLYLDVLVARCMQANNLTFSDEELGRIVAEFARPLSDRFLRHQTIEWAANWARRTGRKLHLYGNGWETHPHFSEFARGALAHGWELGAAFRSAAVNLHAGCNPAIHQRVLDGLASGGFFLIRKHGADVSHRVARAIFNHLKRNSLQPPAAIHMNDLPHEIRSEYAELRRYNGCDPNLPFVQTARHFEQYERLFEKKTVQLAGQLWPDLDRIVFASEAEFVARLDYFLANASERSAIANSMRRVAIENHSYESLMRRMLDWMTKQLERQAMGTIRANREHLENAQSPTHATLSI